jgi:hypothetical protein
MMNIKQVFLQGSRKKIIIMLGVLVALVVLDGVLTQYLVPTGAATESNPFLAPLIGENTFMILKVVGSILCALILYDIHRRYPRVAVIATWVAVAGYAAIVLWNTSLILMT